MQSFIGLCLLLAVGQLLRMKVRVLRKLYLPSCVIAGLLGLIVVQVVVSSGVAMPHVLPRARKAADPPDAVVLPAGWQVGDPIEGELPKWSVGKPKPADWVTQKSVVSRATRALVEWTAGWGKLPGLLINVVFACLFLGMRLPKMGTLARRAGPQLAYGQVVAWGQYVVGIGLFLLVIHGMYPQLPEMFGAIVPVGFEGGHGTAAGLAKTFTARGWEDGKNFALASATIGMISAIIVGMALINWAERRGVVAVASGQGKIGDETGVIPVDKRPEAGKLTVSADAIGSLTLHLMIVGLAIGIGWALLQGMGALAGAIGNKTFSEIADGFPMFPLCMLGGLVVQLLDDKFDKARLIDHGLMKRIQNLSLDFLVVAAIATISLSALHGNWAPLLMICAAGILWNVFCVLVLAKRMLPDAWFERSIAEMGQSMGVTATGLLLLRVVDPEYETPAADAFAAKQLLHEPFMGGGLWTSAAVPLLAIWGGWPVFWIAAGAMTVWFVIVFGAKALKRA